MRAEALLFDKDGTLFDFQATWAPFGAKAVRELSSGNDELLGRLADALSLQLSPPRFQKDSVVIAGSTLDLIEALSPVLGPIEEDELIIQLDLLAQSVDPVEAIPLAGFFSELQDRGLHYGIATNDSERAARENLRKVGLLDRIPFVVGYDSGYGGKPGAGMCRAFLAHCDVSAERAVMVGDSLHDVAAGRAAGMQTIAVLTGTASREDLTPHADYVFEHIGEILDWL